MTIGKDLKRLVRARMTKTGESYTAARAQLARTRPSTRATPPALASPPDYAALSGIADGRVQAKTGRTWEEWVRILDGHDATKLTHRERAELVSSRYGAPPWWTQTVAVGYERIRGLRAVGQRMDGTYEASKARTFATSAAKLFDAVAKPAARRKWLGDPAFKPGSATKPKYVRLRHDDGSVVIFGFTAKGKKKTALSVQHSKLPSKEAATRLKGYWAERLDALEEILTKSRSRPKVSHG
jgi:hypothetical protein